MILVRNLRLDIGQSSDRLKVKAARELKLPTWAIKDVKITKRSLDARRKNDIHWLYSAAVTVDNEEKLLAKCKSKNVAAYEEPEYTYQINAGGRVALEEQKHFTKTERRANIALGLSVLSLLVAIATALKG